MQVAGAGDAVTLDPRRLRPLPRRRPPRDQERRRRRRARASSSSPTPATDRALPSGSWTLTSRDMSLSNAIYAVDLLGTAGFALSARCGAVDRRPDFVGMLILATFAAVGGGVAARRDPQPRHPLPPRRRLPAGRPARPSPPSASSRSTFSSRERTFRYFDAIGLGVLHRVDRRRHVAHARRQRAVRPRSSRPSPAARAASSATS